MTTAVTRTREEIAAAHPDVPRVAYSMSEVAAALGITYQQAQKMRRAGLIPAFRVGREFRVYVDHLHAAVKALAEGGAA